MDTSTKTGIDAAKTVYKKAVKKTADPTGDFIGNKIADQLTSVVKSKNEDKKDEINELDETYIPPEKRKETIDDLRQF